MSYLLLLNHDYPLFDFKRKKLKNCKNLNLKENKKLLDKYFCIIYFPVRATFFKCMTLKEVMKNIRKMRALTATTMAIMLGITPSYLSQIENKGNIPAWFVEKMTGIFKLKQDEILKLQSALQEAYKSADDNESLKRRIKKLIQECVAKLYTFISDLFSGDVQASRKTYEEIQNILNEIKEYVEHKEQLPLFS